MKTLENGSMMIMKYFYTLYKKTEIKPLPDFFFFLIGE